MLRCIVTDIPLVCAQGGDIHWRGGFRAWGIRGSWVKDHWVCSNSKKAKHSTLATCMVFMHNVGLCCMWKGWSRWSSCCKDGTQVIPGFSIMQRNTLIMFHVHVGMEIGIVGLHVHTIYMCMLVVWSFEGHIGAENFVGTSHHTIVVKKVYAHIITIWKYFDLKIASPLGCWLVNNVYHVGFTTCTKRTNVGPASITCKVAFSRGYIWCGNQQCTHDKRLIFLGGGQPCCFLWYQ